MQDGFNELCKGIVAVCFSIDISNTRQVYYRTRGRIYKPSTKTSKIAVLVAECSPVELVRTYYSLNTHRLLCSNKKVSLKQKEFGTSMCLENHLHQNALTIRVCTKHADSEKYETGKDPI